MHSHCSDPAPHGTACSSRTRHPHRWQKKFIIGVVLIAVGAMSFFNYFGLFHLAQPWHLAPLLMVLIGVLKMTVYPSIKQFTRGLFLSFLGLWLFAVFEHLMGLTFANSWPLVLIAVGVRIIVESTLRFFLAKEPHHEK